jgi:hypothetical protein
MTASVQPDATEALDAAVAAAAGGIARGQGYPLSTMYPGPRLNIERDARRAVTAAWPVIAAAVEARARADAAAAEREASTTERAVVEAATAWRNCRRRAVRGGDAFHLACVALDDAVTVLLDAQAAFARAATIGGQP